MMPRTTIGSDALNHMIDALRNHCHGMGAVDAAQRGARQSLANDGFTVEQLSNIVVTTTSVSLYLMAENLTYPYYCIELNIASKTSTSEQRPSDIVHLARYYYWCDVLGNPKDDSLVYVKDSGVELGAAPS